MDNKNYETDDLLNEIFKMDATDYDDFNSETRPTVSHENEIRKIKTEEIPAGKITVKKVTEKPAAPSPVKKKKPVVIAGEKEINLYKKVYALLSIIIFVGFLLFFFIMSMTDTDKTVSEIEKRKLATKPPFSVSSFFKGEWMTKFEDYYSDTFPMRDGFISVSKKIETALTRFSGNDEDSVIVKIDKNGEDFGGEGFVVDESGNEVTSKKSEETTTEPSTGMADNNSDYADEKDAKFVSSILIVNKRAMEVFGYYDGMLEKYAGLVNGIADSIGNNATVYSLVVPTAMEFYGTKEYRTGSHSQHDAIKELYEKMNSNVVTVDAYSKLVNKANEYIYFRSDHHWTARGAYYAYQAFCEKANLRAKDLESYKDKGRIEGDFLGTLYGLTNSDVLKNNPDYVEYFMPDEGVEGKIYQNAEMTDGMTFSVVSKNMPISNKYLAFIAGDQPLEKITTPVKNGRKVIILKESYGNAFVPFLCNNFEEVYVLDPRKLTFNLSDFVSKNGITDVILMNYSFGVANPTYTEALGKMF